MDLPFRSVRGKDVLRQVPRGLIHTYEAGFVQKRQGLQHRLGGVRRAQTAPLWLLSFPAQGSMLGRVEPVGSRTETRHREAMRLGSAGVFQLGRCAHVTAARPLVLCLSVSAG
ncbi:hypothetical protein M878_00250 [Streptomyces roseochromogenus subsp. oscitans DS 12.976]|uniref:Uncharacterized protein n=1 Tax=Streptomyces roseochromogenus subsp. oscitans DS 12.976 TaxID=1352936 RepID=V6L6H2_STRRC|nr:hypothetical protein M878_00250 [Streptomyces roseochromogenus subsp. oscitans DS 12.976]